MTDTQDVRRYADAIMAMIKEDQGSGQVPRDVASWDELDASVDTDDYYRQARMPSESRQSGDLRQAVSAEIGRRLAAAQAGPWHVTWSQPGRPALDIGRTMGYATRAEAEAVGRDYRDQHGGSFHVHAG